MVRQEHGNRKTIARQQQDHRQNNMATAAFTCLVLSRSNFEARQHPRLRGAGMMQQSAQPTLAAAQGQTGQTDPLKQVYTWKKRVLGEGTYGRVVLAWHRESGQKHALKFADTRGTDWEREHEVLQQLQHESVMKMLQVFLPCEGRAEVVIASPAADTDLHTFLAKRGGEIGEDTGQTIGTQMCQGLSYVHGRGIVHRDMKPSSVLMTFIGVGKWQIALCDFGLARHLPQTARPRKVTGKQASPTINPAMSIRAAGLMTARVCTVWYRPPELLFRDREQRCLRYGSPVDVWGMGCILYELLHGTPMAAAADEMGSATCIAGVLGPCPENVPWAGSALYQFWARNYHEATILPESQLLSATPTPPWRCVAQVLRWLPEERADCVELLRQGWLRQGSEPKPPGLQGQGGTPSAPQTCAASPGPDSAELSASQDAESRQGSTQTPLSFAATPADVPMPLMSAPAAKETREGRRQCGCSGHCYSPGHRYRNGCDSKTLVVGSKYCVLCCCEIWGCVAPRWHGSFCCAHGRLFKELPAGVRAVRASRHCAAECMPCDLTDFLRWWPQAQHNRAIVMLLALLKEPAVCEALMTGITRLPPNFTGGELGLLLEHVLRTVDGGQHKDELKQLHRQGVGRVTGAASCCRVFGLIRPTTSGPPKKRRRGEIPAASQGKVLLGLGGREYEFTGDYGQLEDLLKITRGMPAWPEIVDAAALLAAGVEIQTLVSRLADVCPGFQSKSADGYVRRFVVRKLLCGCWLHTPWAKRHSLDWSAVPLAALASWCPDQTEKLSLFPRSWTAQDVSAFLFDRPDWGMIASMLMCLWSEAVGQSDEESLLSCVASPAFGEAARSYKRQHGVAAHPGVLLKVFQRVAR